MQKLVREVNAGEWVDGQQVIAVTQTGTGHYRLLYRGNKSSQPLNGSDKIFIDEPEPMPAEWMKK